MANEPDYETSMKFVSVLMKHASTQIPSVLEDITDVIALTRPNHENGQYMGRYTVVPGFGVGVVHEYWNSNIKPTERTEPSVKEKPSTSKELDNYVTPSDTESETTSLSAEKPDDNYWTQPRYVPKPKNLRHQTLVHICRRKNCNRHRVSRALLQQKKNILDKIITKLTKELDLVLKTM